MAVTPPPLKIGDYWPRYRKRAVFFTAASQAVIVLLILGTLGLFGILDSVGALILGAIVLLVATTALNILLVIQLLSPLKNLSDALTHISGEPTIVTPPNPNTLHFERDGFKPLLQLIYTLSAGKGDEKKETSAGAKGSAIDLSSVVSDLPIGFIALNSERKVTYANAAAPVHVDTDGSMKIDLLFDGDTTLTAWLDTCAVRAVHEERIWQRIPNKIPGEEGRKIYDISASYQKGRSAETVLVLLDRSQIYQPEDDNLDFIAFAAHELRGPITVIRGYLDVLSDELSPQLEPDQSELISRLVVSANRLSSYINNILNASRYDRRHLKVRLREDTLASIYASINDDMQLRAVSQHRLLSVDLPENLPSVAADATSIGEVLGNLIDNAIKYSNEGGAVNVRAEASGDYVTVSVEDHGIGMPAQVVSNLFHKFYRSHRSRETVAGTGIGLYICKAIIESHGGTIGVKSTEGQGSTFSFSLPVYQAVAEKLRANDNSNEGIIDHGEGWIKNHAMFRG